MELRQLRYFLAVAEELNFSRAAERCYVSQSAISLQIAKLEREMREPLFERTSRSVQLTTVGTQLVSIARHMMDLEQTALALTARSRNQLRLTANMTFAANAIAAIVQVRERHPEAEIDFVLKRFAEQIEAVTSGDCQVALIPAASSAPDSMSPNCGPRTSWWFSPRDTRWRTRPIPAWNSWPPTHCSCRNAANKSCCTGSSKGP